MLFYAKSTGGFYFDGIHGVREIDGAPNPATVIPLDAVEITESVYTALMVVQAQGQRIESDANGYPVAGEQSDVPPVQQVSKRQAALALYDAGKYEAVLDALAQNPRAKVEWDASATIERSSPLVTQIAQGLGLDLDALFADAAGR